jgi:aldehyde:ferredoxin oxidoreductase
MAPVFMNEYLSRKDYYESYLRDMAKINPDGRSDEEKMALLQDFRRKQYETLTDVVYKEKGYDRNGIPTDETMKRLGFDNPEFMAIVRDGRKRVG